MTMLVDSKGWHENGSQLEGQYIPSILGTVVSPIASHLDNGISHGVQLSR